MKMTVRRLALLILLCLLQNSFAQNKAKEKADYYFKELLFAKAIPEYEKMIEAGLQSDYAHQKLAECYLKMGNTDKAFPHLKTAVLSAVPPPPDFYFKYGLALYHKGDKKEAEKWLQRYDEIGQNDVRIKTFLRRGSLVSVDTNKGEKYEIENVDFNSELSDFGAFAKGNDIYFSSARTYKDKANLYGWNGEPWLDIYMLKANDSNAKPVPLPGNVNSDYHESSMVFSLNHKKETVLYFTGNKYFKFKGKNYFNKRKKKDLEAKLNLKIFSAIKSSGKWIVNQDLPINSEQYSTGHPFVTADGKYLYFTSDRPGGYGGADIYYAPIHERGGIGKPKNVGPIINTTGNEMFPFLDKEGRLFFTSDGHVGFGQLDIFSTVLDEENKIAGVVNLGSPMNSPFDDFGYFKYDNGAMGYFSSNRPGGKGSDDIYKFKFTPALSIEGFITDAINKKSLDKVSILLYEQNSNKVLQKLTTDSNGKFSAFLEREKEYRIEVNRTTHHRSSKGFSTRKIANFRTKLSHGIILEPKLDMKLLADLKRIKFNSYKSEIRRDAALELDKIVGLMTNTYPKMVIAIEAHTTPLGSHEDNDWLSAERAAAVYNYLLKKGISANRIQSYTGFGKRKSINGCDGLDCTNEELELSARIEFPIIQMNSGEVPVESIVSESE